MCLLVKSAPNTEFPLAWFQDAYSINSDGFGIAYVRDAQVHTHKIIPRSAQHAYEFWQTHAPRDIEYAIHWRMRTHGAIDIERVHPYKINDDLYILHNGILGCVPNDPVKSDTQIYAETFGAELGETVFNAGVQKFIGKQIGSSNRFIFLHATLGLTIINESTGVTTDHFPDCWFSNTYAWTPSKWGVDSGWSNYRGNVSARWSYAGVDEDGVDVDVDIATANEQGLEIDMLAHEIYELALTYERWDQSATRFLNLYESEAEFKDQVRAVFLGDADGAIDALTTSLQYLEDGKCNFEDVMTWFRDAEDDDDSTQYDETLGELDPAELARLKTALASAE